MSLEIRKYHPSDLPWLYRICLQTGNNGKDASRLYQDPDLLGHFYAAPYAVLEPELCFVLTRQGHPCGYILGTRDSHQFQDICNETWFPHLRERYPMPEQDDTSADATMIRLFHIGYRADEDLAGWPAHLHIDILPEGQGGGFGRKLIQLFIEKLKTLEVPGLHLIVSSANQGAVRFYEKTGFEQVKQFDGAIGFGMKF